MSYIGDPIYFNQPPDEIAHLALDWFTKNVPNWYNLFESHDMLKDVFRFVMQFFWPLRWVQSLFYFMEVVDHHLGCGNANTEAERLLSKIEWHSGPQFGSLENQTISAKMRIKEIILSNNINNSLNEQDALSSARLINKVIEVC